MNDRDLEYVLATSETSINRFIKKIFVSIEGCWEWTGSLWPNGYGRFSLRRQRPEKAHRISWIIHNKSKIPHGMYICHTCDNKKCVNPSHLFLGCPTENHSDMVKKGRARYGDRSGEKNPAAKLKIEDVVFIRKSKLSVVELAIKFNVSTALIYKVKRNEVWKN